MSARGRGAPIVEFGYLTVSVDMTKKTRYPTITFNDRTTTRVHDTLRLDLNNGTIR